MLSLKPTRHAAEISQANYSGNDNDKSYDRGLGLLAKWPGATRGEALHGVNMWWPPRSSAGGDFEGSPHEKVNGAYSKSHHLDRVSDMITLPRILSACSSAFEGSRGARRGAACDEEDDDDDDAINKSRSA